MNNRSLNIISIIAGISLIGILITQGTWLRITTAAAEQHFNHRADQMLNNIVKELQTYADTSERISLLAKNDKLHFYDKIDTVLLKSLINKYAQYHMLDSVLSYALITSSSGKILFASENFNISQEEKAYKVCLSCIWKKEYIHLSVYFPNKTKNIIGSFIIWVVVSLLFTLATIGAFVFIILSIYKQKKIAEIKNDFVNNMTHELKTPLSTISVASEVLMQMQNNPDNNKVKKYSKIIFDENHRMRKLVDKVLNIATMDKGRITIDKEETDIHQTICKTVSNFCLEACSEEVKINYQLNAENPIIQADLLHVRNIINNLIDNAIKYSTITPIITISTNNVPGYLKISISDQGKGIPKDALNKVFDKFYRVPSGNIHNVKGFGLGLFYVKSMIEAHNGKVEIQSVLKKGTNIDLYIPQ
jgi:two-component system, OmpR family, phosphate regulon sensor histidine kinase PhoR